MSGYTVSEVPAAPSGSRWYIGISPGGFGTDPGTNLAGALNTLSGERERELAPASPPVVEVALKQVSLVGGQYVLEDRGCVRGYASFESERPGKVWRKMEGAELLDSFALGLDAWKSAPDGEVWNALREVCELHGIVKLPLRAVQDAVCLLVALRAGLKLDKYALPHPDGLVRKAA